MFITGRLLHQGHLDLHNELLHHHLLRRKTCTRQYCHRMHKESKASEKKIWLTEITIAEHPAELDDGKNWDTGKNLVSKCVIAIES